MAQRKQTYARVRIEIVEEEIAQYEARKQHEKLAVVEKLIRNCGIPVDRARIAVRTEELRAVYREMGVLT